MDELKSIIFKEKKPLIVSIYLFFLYEILR